MRNLLSTISLLILLTAGTVPTLAQKTRSKPEDAIRAADQQWLKVFAARELEESVAFCSDDGSVLAPNVPIATGKQAIGKLFSGFFALPNLNISWQPDKAEVAKSGDLGYTSGKYQMRFNDASGKLISDRGKYVTVWKKQRDGSWKVFLDIFNSDLPMTAP